MSDIIEKDCALEQKKEVFDDMKTEYYSWLVIPLRIRNSKVYEAYFKNKEKYVPELEDLTIQARSMFGNHKSATANCWRIDSKTIEKEAFNDNTQIHFYLENSRFDDEEKEFRIYTSWIFSFSSYISFLCLGITTDDPVSAFMLADFGYNNRSVKIKSDNKKIDFHNSVYYWLEKQLGTAPYFETEYGSKCIDKLFVDTCIFNLALRKKRFADLKSLQNAVFNLHLGLKINDSWMEGKEEDIKEEEDIRFVFGAKNKRKDKDNKGSYRWGCCVTSQTLNFIFGAFDINDPNKDKAIDEFLMSGLPLMIIALHQRYQCFLMIEKMNNFSNLKSSEREKLKDTVTQFVAYGTLPAYAISRWYNVKQIYYHLIELLGVNGSVEDVTRKLNMLIDESEKQTQKVIENLNTILSVFGIVAIPASLIQLFQFFTEESPVWQRIIIIIVLGFFLGMFLFGWFRRITKKTSS